MRIWSIVAAVAAIGMVVGCGGDGNGLVNVPNPRVRFANLFPDITSAKAQVGSDEISSDIQKGTLSDYAITPNGNKDLTAGDSTFNNLATLTNQLYETNKHYTGIGFGVTVRSILLLEENESKAGSGLVAIRAAHVAEGAGNVDVYITNAADGDTLPASPSVGNIAAGTLSSSVELPVGSGTTQVRVRVYAAGQTTTAVLDTNIAFTEKERATIAVYLNGATLSALKIKEDI